MPIKVTKMADQEIDGTAHEVIAQLLTEIKARGDYVSCVCVGVLAAAALWASADLIAEDQPLVPTLVCTIVDVPIWFIPCLAENQLHPIVVTKSYVPGAPGGRVQ